MLFKKQIETTQYSCINEGFVIMIPTVTKQSNFEAIKEFKVRMHDAIRFQFHSLPKKNCILRRHENKHLNSFLNGYYIVLNSTKRSLNKLYKLAIG